MKGVFPFSILAVTSSAKSLYSSFSFDPLQHLAGIAPYFEPQDPPRDPSPPQGCNVTRAAYLVRHAAINANDFDYEEYLEPFIEKYKNNTNVNWASIPQLSFLQNWVPPQLTEQELLTRTGKLEAAQLGVTVSYKYPNLRSPQRVWASTAERTVKSAEGFIRGLEVDDNQINLVQVYEGKQAGADTLTPYSSCGAYSSSAGSDQSGQYQTVYTAPILARLNALAGSFNFTEDDVFAMQEMCGYETVIRGSSPFCSLDLFNPDEWLGFEYTNDIMYHYNTGYGNPISGVVGFPWLNATMNLLTSSSASQDLYISFTHRELPPTVLVAMGLFNNTQFSTASSINNTMPLKQINYNRAWVSSYILPFLSNIAIERMDCSQNYYVKSGASNPNSGSTYYRVLVNNAPQTLPDCHDGPSESCSAGALQAYLSERAAMFEGYSQKCNQSYSNSTDYVTFYTNQDNGTMVGK
ncbi:hypothetical protein H2198_006616 [Neophaeococcomyces mojaviensis]|uniref:Uncharacterized protein n=1 Tax=Neophaeococcomyces mojaviensis TaxID=3383035 RepID=A0ACC3A2F4_9EURO|nr:hypothetical protein H2198_006616 [Knufia sp. JES_112]